MKKGRHRMKIECDVNSAWILKEKKFNENLLGKCESIFCLGNGYMGLRSATEERYINETRDLLIAGTYNKANRDEVTELPNAPDLIGVELSFNGERFSLANGTILSYERSLNMKNGELNRRILWISPKGIKIELLFKRMVSMDNLHLIAQKIQIKAVNTPVHLSIKAGIDGTMTNHGVTHFVETEKRFYENKYMQYVGTTVQSQVGVVLTTALIFKYGEEPDVLGKIGMSRRKIYCDYEVDCERGQMVTIEKISEVCTTLDRETEEMDLRQLQKYALGLLKDDLKTGYEELLEKSGKIWNREVWTNIPIKIESDEVMDQAAIYFAQYHLAIMTPRHDERCSIGAKGLSGEGYKGHIFWDTDIFILPYYNFSMPETARKLELYRYANLNAARQKAASGNYEGAQYPWETAGILDGEVTPRFGDADIITGLPQTIWTGKIEQHITADVIYGVWQYYQVTKDCQFMENCGYEMIFETARFWNSRLEEGIDHKYHINDVIGPDEYKEHVNDNAYTNYMAYWNMERAIECYRQLENKKAEVLRQLEHKIGVSEIYRQCKEKIHKIYLPQPDTQEIIDQDTAYRSLKEIDLTKYKEQDYVLGIYKDYNARQINEIQVSKQADVLLTFFLLEEYFTLEQKRANWDYYEKKTLHDSSLSLSTHCIIANDLTLTDRAYQMFEKLINTDLGENGKSSDDGIHGASMGGIWKAVVFGFGGIRLIRGKLRINPLLPQKWKRLVFPMILYGSKISVDITKTQIVVERLTGKSELELEIKCNRYVLGEGKITINHLQKV